MKLHLGCGKSPEPGAVNLDMTALPGVDVVFDLDRCRTEKLPFADDSFDEVFGSHVIEHIHDTLALMQELHRVAKPGCKLIFRCPYGSSDDAWENPTHVRPYFLGSFGFFSQPFFWKEDYGYRGDWQVERVNLIIAPHVLDAVHRDEAKLQSALQTMRNIVQEMVVEMVAVKPIRPMDKALQTPLTIKFLEARQP